jgi:hypothetical protein
MASTASSVLARLCEAGSPVGFDDWTGEDGYYVGVCRASAEDIPHLITIASKWSDPEWPFNEEELNAETPDLELLPITAWRTLADLKSSEAVQPLLDMMCELDDEYDDWASSELPHVFGKIGEPAIESLVEIARNSDKSELVRRAAINGLRYVAKYYSEQRDRIVSCLTEMMANAAENGIGINSALLVDLVELHAVEAAEPIERAFAANLLDLGMMGDWEDVRRRLGVEGLRLEMPSNAYNSLDELRKRMGIGIFSTQPVFGLGEIDEDAEQDYYQRAWDAFSKSEEAQQVVDRLGDLGWYESLLRFGISYRGETVDQMTVASMSDFVFDYMPRKVSVEPERASDIIFELIKFWVYLVRVFELPEAKSIVEWLNAEQLVGELEVELADVSNYGMAKSIYMSGKQAGYDMTSEAGMAEYIAAYNQSLQHPNPTPLPVTTETRVNRIGRNDPCPCGSGKKFKKCCR